ncbi:DUF4158 domain-containing protein [Gluconobacter sp. OJA]
MARRDLLTDSERHALFSVPDTREDLARHYILSPRDLALVVMRRGDENRLGFAVQLALMRHPGFGFTLEGSAPEHLVAFMAEQIDVPAWAFDNYALRPATASVHAREVGDALGLRGPTNADLPLLIEAGAKAAWSTDRGLPIVSGIMEVLRADGITLPSQSVIERAGIAGRARARKRTYDALLAYVSVESLAKLDATLIVDPKTGVTSLAWLREIATVPTPDNVRGLLDRLAYLRAIELPVTIGNAIHADRLRQLIREGRASSVQLIGRYTPSRRRATLAAMILDLETRLTDAVLDIADRIIGGSFTRGNNKQKRSYAETTRDVGHIMRLFDQTVAALAEAQEIGMEGFAAVDAAVGWDKLLRARGQARQIADLTAESPLVRAADQWSRLRKFAPLFLEAIDFKAGRGSASTIAALNTLREMNRSGSRDVPPDAPMPFRKEWRTLVRAGGGKPDRRLWETGVLAHLRNKWRSGDIWVERSANYRKFDSYMLSSAEVEGSKNPLLIRLAGDFRLVVI